MPNPARVTGSSLPGVILRKLAIVFLAGLVGGISFAFIGLANRTILPTAFEVATSAGLGLLAGFTSRRALRGHTFALRALASIAAVIVPMVFLGWISGGERGLVIHTRGLPQPDWDGLLRISLSGVSACLALSAWERSKPQTPAAPPAQVERDRTPRRSIRQPSPDRSSSKPTRTRTLGLSSWSESAMELRHALERTVRGMRGWKDRISASWIRAHLPAWEWPTRSFGRRATQGGLKVRLLGVEEHRCPYCLDIVERRDPRGVVTCKLCRTRHHADCWAVAGMCQVPHHHH